VRQDPEDRALFYRQLRTTVAGVFAPELTSPTAQDAAALVDRILAEFIVEEEHADALSDEFGGQFAALLGTDGDRSGVAITAQEFVSLRARAADLVGRCADSTDPGERAQALALADVERRYLERVDELRRAVLAESGSGPGGEDVGGGGGGGLGHPSGGGTVSAERLGAYLRRASASPDLQVTAVEPIPGGRSKETLVVSLQGAPNLPAQVVVRRDRPVGLLQTRALEEFAVLQAVHAHGGVPVPRPLFADEAPVELDEPGDAGAGSAAGGPRPTLLVMERVDGTRAGEYFPEIAAPPPAHRRAIGAQLAGALAHLHTVPLSSLGATGLDAGAGTDAGATAQTLLAAVDAMATRIEELSGPPIATVPLARRWLIDHVDDVTSPGPLCLLQSDVGLHNMLVDGDRLTALVDWEAAAIGPPARELAAAWPAASALSGWDAFVEEYLAAGGPPEATDPRAVAYYRVFLCLGGTMTSRTGGHLFRTGAKRDLVTAHSGLDAHFRAQRNLARALHDARGGAAAGGGT
jgi:aminoglycoside phosphotransferase (APT) family kinase protein